MARERPTRQQLSLMVQQKGLKTLIDEQPAFRKFIWTVFTEAGIFVPTYSRGSPHDTSYNEGRRALGLEVLHMLKHVQPDILAIVEREGNLLASDVQAAAPQNESEDYDAPLPYDDQDER